MEQKRPQSCSQWHQHSQWASGGAGRVPVAPPLLPFMLSLATSAVSPASADDFGNCLFSPFPTPREAPFHLPASQPPPGRQGSLQTQQVQSQVHCLFLPPDLLPSWSSSVSANSASLIGLSYNPRVTSTFPSPGCLSTLVPPLLPHSDCPRTLLLGLSPGSVFC